jgi:hypothetical protein
MIGSQLVDGKKTRTRSRKKHTYHSVRAPMTLALAKSSLVTFLDGQKEDGLVVADHLELWLGEQGREKSSSVLEAKRTLEAT